MEGRVELLETKLQEVLPTLVQRCAAWLGNKLYARNVSRRLNSTRCEDEVFQVCDSYNVDDLVEIRILSHDIRREVPKAVSHETRLGVVLIGD
jgi:hypothetical protein